MPKISGMNHFEVGTEGTLPSFTKIENSMQPIPQPKTNRCIVLETFMMITP